MTQQEKELRAKREAKFNEIRELIKPGFTPDVREKYEAAMTELRDMDGDIARFGQIAEVEAEERKRVEAEERAALAGRPALASPGSTATKSEVEERAAQYRKAYARYIETGDKTELRAMGTTTGAGGGYGIPTDLVREIEQAVLQYGGIASSLRPLNTDTGETMDWPLSNDVANAATVITENTADTENDLVLGQTALNVSTLRTGIVLVSNQILQDFQAESLADFVKENMVERANRGLSNYLTGVSTDANFDNILASHVGATTAAPTAINLADITNIFGAVDPGYADSASAKFAMHRSTQLYLGSLRNANGYPIFPLDADGMLTKLYAKPIVVDQSYPALTAGAPVAAAKYITFGAMNKYILRRVNGFAIKRLEERYAEYNQTAFMLFFRAGGRSLDAGTHPIQVLQQHA